MYRVYNHNLRIIGTKTKGKLIYDDNFSGGCFEWNKNFEEQLNNKIEYISKNMFGKHTDEQKKIIIDKWEKVKDLVSKKSQDTDYPFYFNFENIKDLFTKEVERLAKEMNIEYELKIKN